jgi:hypothetical protein
MLLHFLLVYCFMLLFSLCITIILDFVLLKNSDYFPSLLFEISSSQLGVHPCHARWIPHGRLIICHFLLINFLPCTQKVFDPRSKADVVASWSDHSLTGRVIYFPILGHADIPLVLSSVGGNFGAPQTLLAAIPVCNFPPQDYKNLICMGMSS